MELGEVVRTFVKDDKFCISITEESDISTDGGYTFEDVTNVWELDDQDAQALLKELQEFLDRH